METSRLGRKSVAISECTVVILYRSQTNQTQDGTVIIHDIIASWCRNLEGRHCHRSFVCTSFWPIGKKPHLKVTMTVVLSQSRNLLIQLIKKPLFSIDFKNGP